EYRKTLCGRCREGPGSDHRLVVRIRVVAAADCRRASDCDRAAAFTADARRRRRLTLGRHDAARVSNHSLRARTMDQFYRNEPIGREAEGSTRRDFLRAMAAASAAALMAGE